MYSMLPQVKTCQEELTDLREHVSLKNYAQLFSKQVMNLTKQ